MSGFRVVVGGPRASGKSTFSASLFVALQEQGVAVGIHEIDVYSDSLGPILGIKPWEARKKRKWAWFDPTIRVRIEEFCIDTNAIVLGDLPGKITNQFLPRMVEHADCALIVSKDLNGMLAWDAFFQEHHIPVMIRVASINGTPDARALFPNGAVRISGLDRTIIRSNEIVTIASSLLAISESHPRKWVPLS